VPPLPLTGEETGRDLGLEAFATLADGTRRENPRHYRRAERELQTAQRRVSRRKKGSTRRRKAGQLLARKHQKVRRQRTDFHQKTALAVLRHYDTISYDTISYDTISYDTISYDTISHEDVQTANMVGNHHLAKSITDAGWRAFLSILSNKAACAGRSVVAVPPAYTSQVCSGRGALVSKGLSVRWHECPACGTSLHRDHNAAKTIHWLGQRLRGVPAVAGASNREPVAL
jgi:putative transposase